MAVIFPSIVSMLFYTNILDKKDNVKNVFSKTCKQ